MHYNSIVYNNMHRRLHYKPVQYKISSDTQRRHVVTADITLQMLFGGIGENRNYASVFLYKSNTIYPNGIPVDPRPTV